MLFDKLFKRNKTASQPEPAPHQENAAPATNTDPVAPPVSTAPQDDTVTAQPVVSDTPVVPPTQTPETQPVEPTAMPAFVTNSTETAPLIQTEQPEQSNVESAVPEITQQPTPVYEMPSQPSIAGAPQDPMVSCPEPQPVEQPVSYDTVSPAPDTESTPEASTEDQADQGQQTPPQNLAP